MSGNGYLGFQRSNTAATEHGALSFMIRSILARVQTATLVKVMTVTNDGDASPVGFVDILPLVMQASGSGTPIPHGKVHSCPYLRLQGGANAIILDPQPGDIGIAVFASRDLSAVIATRDQAQQGSNRRFDMADGLYLGGVLNGAPQQWVRFAGDGIEIHSPTKVTLDAPAVEISCETLQVDASTSVTVNTPTFTVNGAATINGTAHVIGDSTLDGVLTANGSALLNDVLAVSGVASFSGGIFDGVKSIGAAHTHGGVQTGSGHTTGVV